jgi:hypothetical protein
MNSRIENSKLELLICGYLKRTEHTTKLKAVLTDLWTALQSLTPVEQIVTGVKKLIYIRQITRFADLSGRAV